MRSRSIKRLRPWRTTVLSSNAPPTNLSQSVVAAGFEAADNPSNVTAVLTGLAPGQTNFFFVQSVVDPFPGHYATDLNGGAFYSFTNTASGATDTNVPSAITISQSPSAVFVTNTSALITWQVASSDDNPTNHTHFLVLSESSAPAATNAVVTLGAEDSNGQVFAHLTGLWPGRNYYYYVQSFSDSGLGSADTDDNGGQFYSFTTDTTPVADASSIFGSNGSGGTGGSGSGVTSGSGGTTGGSTYDVFGTQGGSGFGTSSGTDSSNDGGAGTPIADAKNTTAKVTAFFGILWGPDENKQSGDSFKATFSCQGSGSNPSYTLEAKGDSPGDSKTCSFNLTPGEEYEFSLSCDNPPRNLGPNTYGDPKQVQLTWIVSQMKSDYRPSGSAFPNNLLWRKQDRGRTIHWSDSSNPPNPVAKWKMAIPKADLSVANVSENEEETVGAFVPHNSSANAKLLPIVLHKIKPTSMGGRYELTWDENVCRVWKTPNRATGTEIYSDNGNVDASQDTTLYVEGIAPGSTIFHINWWDDTGNSAIDLDRAKVTVIKLNLIQPFPDENHPYVSQPDYNSTGPLSFRARVEGASCSGKIQWNASLEYYTDGSGGPYKEPYSFTSENDQTASQTFTSVGGRLTIKASATVKGLVFTSVITNYITGCSISNDVITSRLLPLYAPSVGTPGLLAGIAWRESTYQQFSMPPDGIAPKYGLTARWPKESPEIAASRKRKLLPRGSFIGLMQVPVAMDTAWNWLKH